MTKSGKERQTKRESAPHQITNGARVALERIRALLPSPRGRKRLCRRRLLHFQVRNTMARARRLPLESRERPLGLRATAFQARQCQVAPTTAQGATTVEAGAAQKNEATAKRGTLRASLVLNGPSATALPKAVLLVPMRKTQPRVCCASCPIARDGLPVVWTRGSTRLGATRRHNSASLPFSPSQVALFGALGIAQHTRGANNGAFFAASVSKAVPTQMTSFYTKSPPPFNRGTCDATLATFKPFQLSIRTCASCF